MREILFRAKREDTGEWVEGDFLRLHKLNESCIAIRGDNQHWCNTQFIPIDPSTLCQFTGLLDKNGERIWEGDVVNSWHTGIHPDSKMYNESFKGYVMFDVRIGAWFIEVDDGSGWYLSRSRQLVRLGSIHDKEQP